MRVRLVCMPYMQVMFTLVSLHTSTLAYYVASHASTAYVHAIHARYSYSPKSTWHITWHLNGLWTLPYMQVIFTLISLPTLAYYVASYVSVACVHAIYASHTRVTCQRRWTYQSKYKCRYIHVQVYEYMYEVASHLPSTTRRRSASATCYV